MLIRYLLQAKLLGSPSLDASVMLLAFPQLMLESRDLIGSEEAWYLAELAEQMPVSSRDG